jgi:hypothetical protein
MIDDGLIAPVQSGPASHPRFDADAVASLAQSVSDGEVVPGEPAEPEIRAHKHAAGSYERLADVMSSHIASLTKQQLGVLELVSKVLKDSTELQARRIQQLEEAHLSLIVAREDALNDKAERERLATAQVAADKRKEDMLGLAMELAPELLARIPKSEKKEKR